MYIFILCLCIRINIAMESIEDQYASNDLLYFRKCAVAQMRKQLNNKAVILRTNMPKDSNIFSSWFGSKKSNDIKPNSITKKELTNLFMKVGLNEDINFDDNSDNKNDDNIDSNDDDKPPRDFKQITFDFELKSASLSLLDILLKQDIPGDKLLGMEFEKMKLNFILRPESSIQIDMELGSMQLNDYFSKNVVNQSMIQRTELINVKDSRERYKILKTLPPLLKLTFELNPLNNIADTSIVMSTQEITADLHIPIFLRLSTFFVQERQVDMHAFERAALLQFEALQNASKAALNDAVQFHKTLYIDAKFKAPTVILRQDASDHNSHKLIFDLGVFEIKSNLQKNVDKAITLNNSNNEYDIISDRDKLKTYYDSFVITVKDVKIYLDEDMDKNHILKPLDIEITLFSCIFPSEPSLPTIIIEGVLPNVDTRLTSSNMKKMYKMVKTIIQNLYQEIQKQNTERNERKKKKIMEQKNDDNDVKSDDSDIKTIVTVNADKVSKMEVMTASQAERELFDDETIKKLSVKINVMVVFQLKKVSFSLIDDTSNGTNNTVIVAYTSGFIFKMIQRKWDLSLNVGIGSVGIEDHICPKSELRSKSGEKIPYLVTTGSFKAALFNDDVKTDDNKDNSDSNIVDSADFFELQLDMTDKASPNFNNADMEIGLNAGDIIFYCRPDTIYKLTEILLTNFLPPAQAVNDQENSLSQAVSILSERQKKKAKLAEEERKRKLEESKNELINVPDKGTIERTRHKNMIINVNFSSLQLYICAKQFDIARASISGFGLKLNMYMYSMDIDISLGNISLTDATHVGNKFKDYQLIMGHSYADDDTPENDLRNILSQNPDDLETKIRLQTIEMRKSNKVGNVKNEIDARTMTELLKIKVSMYSDYEMEYPGYPMKILLRMDGMRFVFLNRFLDEILSWLMNSCLLTLPEFITKTINESELMGNIKQQQPLNEMDKRQQEIHTIDLDAINEDTDDINFDEKKDDSNLKSTLPQLDIEITDMELIVPEATTSKNCIVGFLGCISVTNNVLKNDALNVKILNANLISKFYTLKNNKLHTMPLFNQPSIIISLSNEFTNISVDFNNITMQLSHKQYEFIMHLLQGNLGEQSLIASTIFPNKQIDATEIINEETREQMAKRAKEAAQKAAQKPLKINVLINKLELCLLKGYGKDINGSEAILKFEIANFGTSVEMNPTTEMLSVRVFMEKINLEDVSIETKNQGVLELYRKLIQFDDAYNIEDNTGKFANLTDIESADKSQLPIVRELESNMKLKLSDQYPFYVTVDIHQPSNKISVGVELKGLNLTFGSVLYSVIQFVTIKPAQFEALPEPPKELMEDQIKLLETGDINAVALNPDEYKQKKKEMDRKIEQQKSLEVAEPAASFDLSVNVQIRDTMVKLVRTPTQRHSLALILRTELTTKIIMNDDTPMSIVADSRYIEAFQAELKVPKVKGQPIDVTVREGVPKIIEPFSIKLIVDSIKSQYDSVINPDTTNTAMKGSVEMTKLSVRFGYQDFDLVMHAINATAPPTIEPDNDDDNDVKQDNIITESKLDLDSNAVSLKVSDHESFLPNKSEELNVDDQLKHKQETQIEQKQEYKLTDFGEIDFKIKMKPIDLLLVNDAIAGSNIPIAFFKVNKLHAKISSYRNKMTITAGFRFKGEYYNDNIAEWEPMIEKWETKLSLFQTSECTFIQFRPVNVFNVTVTETMLRSLIKTANIFSQKSEESRKEEAKKKERELERLELLNAGNNLPSLKRDQSSISNYIRFKDMPTHAIKNYTGYKLIVKEFNECSNEEQKDLDRILNKKFNQRKINKPFIVESGFGNSKRFFGTPEKLGKKKKFQNKIGIQIYFGNETDFEPMIFKQMNKLTEELFWLQNPDSQNSESSSIDPKKAIIIVSTIEMVGGVREINLHSHQQFINDSGLTLVIFDHEIKPGNKLWCPLDRREDEFEVTIKDDDDSKHTFDSFKLPLTAYAHKESYNINVKRNDGVNYSLILYTETKNRHVNFVFETRVHIENLLVCPLELVFEQHLEYKSNLKIDPGKTLQGPSVLKSLLSQVKTSVGNMVNRKIDMDKEIQKWIKQAYKRDDDDSKEDNKIYQINIVLQDPTNSKELLINLELSQTGKIPKAVTLTFYVPYWIYDMTGLDLLVSEDKKYNPATNDQIYNDKTANEIEPKMFNYKKSDSNKKIAVKVKNGGIDYSEYFSSEAVGTNGKIQYLFGNYPHSTRVKRDYEVK